MLNMLTSPLNKTILLKPLVNKANGLLHLLPHYKYASISGILTIAPWLLTTGFWDDTGAWDDSATWLELFTPSDLFASGEQGVWYDPSDLTTMFQDAAGTTPVTAVEQPVGLILDKSKGLVLGPELVVNGGFDTAASWNIAVSGTSTASIVGSQATISKGDSFAFITQSNVLTAGRIYSVNLDIVSISGSAAVVNNNGTAYATFTTTGTKSFRFRHADSTQATLFLSAVSGTVVFDNISVRELPGNHASQPTATARPVLSARYNLLTKTESLTDGAWTKQYGTTVSSTLVSAPDGTLTAFSVTGNGSSGIFQAVAGSLPVGQSIRSVWLRTQSGSATVGIKDPALTQGTTTCNVTATWQRFSLTETTVPTSGFVAGIWVFNLPATGIEIAWPDVCPANQSTLPYQRVNTATDYDADPTKFKPYLRFDGVDDFLVTNTITPGTDKVQVFAGVRKLTDIYGVICLTSLTQQGSFALSQNGWGGEAGSYVFASTGTSTSYANAPTNSYIPPITDVITGSSDISSNMLQLRVGGSLISQSSNNQGGGNYLAYPLYIGQRDNSSFRFNGHLYSLIMRFGPNLTADQITQAENWVNSKTGAY